MTAPASICLLRTSAIGDVTHVVPLVHTLQQAWPEVALTWVIGKLERKLVGDLPGVAFVTFDKAAGWKGMRAVHEALRGQRFDALLQMQVAMRSNVLSLGIKANRRIGYDRARARDLHGLLTDFIVARCWTTDQSVMAHRLAILEDFDVSDRLWRLEAPTLVLAGSRDVVIPPSRQQALARSIAGAGFAQVEGAGHIGFLTHRAEVADHLAGFVRKVRRSYC